MAAEGRRDWRTIPMPVAECEEPGCDWFLDARNAHGVGAQHARKHGHKVRIEVHKTYYYNDDKPAGPSRFDTP